MINNLHTWNTWKDYTQNTQGWIQNVYTIAKHKVRENECWMQIEYERKKKLQIPFIVSSNQNSSIMKKKQWKKNNHPQKNP